MDWMDRMDRIDRIDTARLTAHICVYEQWFGL